MILKNKYSIVEKILFPPAHLDFNKLKNTVSEKNILITGASYGIGESLAYLLAPTGANLILVARTEEKLLLVKQEVESLGGKAVIFAADLSLENSVAELTKNIISIRDGIDIIVNNAGKSIKRPIMKSLDRMVDFKSTMGLNYFGPVQLILALIPSIIHSKGQIINISTINVLLSPSTGWAAYQASKSAFDNWLRCVAPELEKSEVVCTSIYPPLVKTRMISPTKEFKNLPAMHPHHLAQIICLAMVKRNKRFAPWWLVFGQPGIKIFKMLHKKIKKLFKKNN